MGSFQEKLSLRKTEVCEQMSEEKYKKHAHRIQKRESYQKIMFNKALLNGNVTESKNKSEVKSCCSLYCQKLFPKKKT